MRGGGGRPAPGKEGCALGGEDDETIVTEKDHGAAAAVDDVRPGRGGVVALGGVGSVRSGGKRSTRCLQRVRGMFIRWKRDNLPFMHGINEHKMRVYTVKRPREDGNGRADGAARFETLLRLSFHFFSPHLRPIERF